MRAAVTGPFSFMKGKLGRYLDLDEHLALGVTIAWYPGFTHHVTWPALWDFMTAFQSGGVKAWDAFVESRRDRPYPVPEVPEDGESGAKQQALSNVISRQTTGVGSLNAYSAGVSDGTRRLQDLRLRHACWPGCAHPSRLFQRG